MTQPEGLEAKVEALLDRVAQAEQRLQRVEYRLQSTLEVNNLWDGS